METRFPQYIEDVDRLGEELRKLGLVPDNTYLYMQGHHIMDCVVLKLLIPVCTVLRREREQEIKRLAEHSEQFRNELTGYENSQVNVSVMLKKNSGYKNLYLYQWLKKTSASFSNGKNSDALFILYTSYFIPNYHGYTKEYRRIIDFLGTAPSLADMLDQFIAFVLVLIVAFLADVICRNILLKVVAHLIRKTKSYMG